VYSCDHFVEPGYLLGNINSTPIAEMVSSEQQQQFGAEKSNALPRYCRECTYLFTCHGECPKNRVLTTPDGEPGLNWLCEGLKAFFAHTERPMKLMAELLRRGQPADLVMGLLAQEEKRLTEAIARAGRNDPCPCGAKDADGNSIKFKKCHGK
jgi:uncharacterized protein